MICVLAGFRRSLPKIIQRLIYVRHADNLEASVGHSTTCNTERRSDSCQPTVQLHPVTFNNAIQLSGLQNVQDRS